MTLHKTVEVPNTDNHYIWRPKTPTGIIPTLVFKLNTSEIEKTSTRATNIVHGRNHSSTNAKVSNHESATNYNLLHSY
jgi:hypothetical protein